MHVRRLLARHCRDNCKPFVIEQVQKLLDGRPMI
jgi:hypothetical protein